MQILAYQYPHMHSVRLYTQYKMSARNKKNGTMGWEKLQIRNGKWATFGLLFASVWRHV